MLKANVEGRYRVTNWLHMAAQGVPMVAHGPHVAAQRLLLGALGAAFGCSEAPNGCPWVHLAAQELLLGAIGAPCGRSETPYGRPWSYIWLLRGCIWLQRGCILLHRVRLWLPCSRYAAYAASGWAGLGSQDPENMPS